MSEQFEHPQRRFLPIRKIVHLSGALFPLIALNFGTYFTLGIVSLLILLFLIAEIAKHKFSNNSMFRTLWREKESDEFALAPFLYLLSILLLLVLSLWIDEGLCYAAIIVLTIGDGLSTIIGVHGSVCYAGSSKTVEGTFAGLIGATVLAYPFAGMLAIVGGSVGMYFELKSDRMDNVAVPFSALISMLIAQLLVNAYI